MPIDFILGFNKFYHLLQLLGDEPAPIVDVALIHVERFFLAVCEFATSVG
jgi:hypothetical protein